MNEIEQRSANAAADSCELVDLIRPLFAGLEPEIVGAVLGQLIAILVAGHAPELREHALATFIDLARELVPVEVEIMIDNGMAGPEWRGTKQ